MLARPCAVHLEAPAKLNLTLEVLGKRADGYHEVRSLAQGIDLTDTITIEPAPRMTFSCTDPAWVAQRSLVALAVQMLRGAKANLPAVAISIKKRVPLLAGLGGDATDAASVLRGLTRLWGLDPAMAEDVAPKLGSDVPFLLRGGTALLYGRGELVRPLAPLQGLWFVLLFPHLNPGPGKTQRLYSTLQEGHFTGGEFTQRLSEAVKEARELDGIPFFNVFDSVADEVFPGLSRYWECFLQAGATQVHLAGAGPTLYAPFTNPDAATRVLERLTQAGLKVCLALPRGQDAP